MTGWPSRVCISDGLRASTIQAVMAPVDTQVLGGDGFAGFSVEDDDLAHPLPYILEIGGQR